MTFYLILIVAIIHAILGKETNEEYIDLENGVMQGPFLLQESKYQRFTFSPPILFNDTGISVAFWQERGDCDLYASCNNPHPNQHMYSWRSISNNSADFLSISRDELGACPTLYIAAFGYTDNEFSVIAYSWNTRLQLSLGSEQVGVVRNGMYDYYRYINLRKEYLNVTIETGPVTGATTEGEDLDIYVASGYWPDKYHNDYVSKGVGISERVIFGVQPGKYNYIAVLASSSPVSKKRVVNYMIRLYEVVG